MRRQKKASKLFVILLAMMALCGLSKAAMAEEAPTCELRSIAKMTGSEEQAGAPRLGFRLGATNFMLGDNAVGPTLTKALCQVIGPYCDSQGNCGWTSENLCCLWECWF